MDIENTPSNAQEPGIPDVFSYLGQTLHTVNQTYEVVKYLGAGLTAVVFEGKQQSSGDRVALKILRPEASALSKSNFWDECDVIGELLTAGVTCVPRVLDQSRGQLPEFLVMDLVSPTEYPGLDLVLRSCSYLQEDESLRIACEAFELLDRLHTMLQRAYTDMQLKNFCWKSSEQRLLVIDWNHVSYRRSIVEKGLDEKNPDVLRQLRGRGASNFDDMLRLDLARLTTYLFTLLTGKAASERGETVWRLKNRAAQRWEQISLATRQIILRVLAPSIGTGLLTTAKEIVEELESAKKLLGNDDVESLQDAFDEYFDRIDGARESETRQDRADGARGLETNEERIIQQQKDLDTAAIYLDRLQRLDVNDPALKRWIKLKKELWEKLGGRETANWRTGRNFYEVESFGEAYRFWSEDAESQGSVETWRWALVARVCAETLFPLSEESKRRVRMALEEGVQNLTEGRLPEAKLEFERAREVTEHPLLDQWLEEVDALSHLVNHDYREQAMDPGKSAEELATITKLAFWKDLPYVGILLRDDIWFGAVRGWVSPSVVSDMRDYQAVDLKAKLEELAAALRAENQERLRDSRLVEELRALAGEEFADALKKALIANPNRPDVVRMALEYAAGKSPEESLETLDLITGWASITPSQQDEIKTERVSALRKQLDELTAKARAALDETNLPSALDAVRKARSVLDSLQQLDVQLPASHGELRSLDEAIGGAQQIEKRRTQEATKAYLSLMILQVCEELRTELDIKQSPTLNIWSLREEDLTRARTTLNELKIRLDNVGKAITRSPAAEQAKLREIYRNLSVRYERVRVLVAQIDAFGLVSMREKADEADRRYQASIQPGHEPDLQSRDQAQKLTKELSKIKKQLLNELEIGG